MSRLRLNPAALAVPAANALVLRSPLGTFELKGRDAPVFLDTLAPLLDGSRTASAIADAVPAYSRASVLAFLDLLVRRGLVEPVVEPGEASVPAASIAPVALLHPVEQWPPEARARLAAARVLIVGAAPWGGGAAEALARAGVGTLHRVYDGVVAENDALILPDGPWDLILGATAADDLWLLYRLARAAQILGAPSLTATLDGPTARLGPAVVPGQTACWNCCRLRLLANARHREATHALQAALLAARYPLPVPAYLAPAAAQLGQLLALEALKLLAGAPDSPLRGRLLVQDLLTLETHLHTVIRMPWCPVCGGAASDPTEAAATPPVRLDPAADPDELRAALAGWVDSQTGVIRRLTLLRPDDGAPDLPVVALAVPGVYTEGTYTAQEPLYASGKGRSATEALIGAVGEGIERYSAARFCRPALLRCAPAALQDEYVDPRDLALFSAAQYAAPGFPYRPVDPDQPLDWVRGRWLDTGAPVWVPALAAYLHFPAPPAERFGPVTSNGLAAGRDLDDAALRALWEVIERDAFMIAWLAQVPGQPVVLDASLPPEAGEVVRQLAARGVAVELYRADAGLGIPALVALALGDGEDWPGLVVGMAAHPDPCVAARKAVFEVAAVAPQIRRQMRDGDPPIPLTPDAVRTLHDHALYYAPADRVALADPFRRGGTPTTLGDLPVAGDGSPAACADRLQASGVRVAFVDVTAPDVYASPFRVVRAVGVGTQPIRFGHGLQALATPRLLARLTRGLNPHPHPVA